MSRMRQVIASRLTDSFTTTPHFFVTVAVDMTELVNFRSELKAQGDALHRDRFHSESCGAQPGRVPRS